MRKLIYIPIIHTEVDLGELATTIRERSIREKGRDAWEKKVQTIDRYWDAVEASLFREKLPFDNIRIYQDGLPVCNREKEIVQDLAESGSRNHQLIVKLAEQGAQIMGTESPDLLLLEYENIKQEIEAKTQPQKQDPETLLEKRDQFIGERINTTLEQGQTGILFLGMLHSIKHYIQKDIVLVEFDLHQKLA